MIQQKPKTIFDHANQIMVGKDPLYFSKISEEDKKSWSNWMINKILSMTPEYCESINEIQRYQFLEPELYYKILIELIPKRKVFSKYIKSSKNSKFSEEDLVILGKYFMISSREIKEYSDLISEELLNQIYKEHGIEK